METIVYILAAVAGVMAIYALIKAGLFKRKKNKKSADSGDKPKDKPKEEPKPDAEFKITKKERLSKISKKALDTNSRTATIEPVFAKTKEDSQDSKPVIEIAQKLSPDNEDLVSAIEQIDTEERKVVSLTELKKQADIKKQAEITEQKVMAEGIKTIDGSSGKRTRTGRAGEVTGEYSGISIGKKGTSFSPKKSKDENKAQETKDEDEDLDFSGFFGGNSPFMDPEFNPFRNRNRFFNPEPQKEPEKPKKKFDIVDAVQAEAILNPKFKNKSKK